MSNSVEKGKSIKTDPRDHHDGPNGPRRTPGDNSYEATSFLQSAVLGTILSSCFLILASRSPENSVLNRYFLGHPIAMTATILFWFAFAILTSKWLWLSGQKRQCETLRDEDLAPNHSGSTPAEIWHAENNLQQVASHWTSSLEQLPRSLDGNHLVKRLKEIVHRQSQRGSSKLLADDLREISNRDADAAHDSYGLVRIISWAIPMLGFLGTVIGITQTLGGLDFSNGNAAVENLKSGLYVAFDTTAVGLVLSVLAIFLQFPIERSEQRFLATIDFRVSNLVSSNLPADRDGDDPTHLIAPLLSGIQTAIAESMNQQANLWRQTISETQNHWRQSQESHAEQISKAIDEVLSPAINKHSERSASAILLFNEGLQQHADLLNQNLTKLNEDTQRSFDHSNQKYAEHVGETLDHISAQNHQAVETTLKKLQDLQAAWISASKSSEPDHMDVNGVSQAKRIRMVQEQTHSLLTLQKSLDANLRQIHSTNKQVQEQISGELTGNLTDAMRYLARTVDHLSGKLGEDTKRRQVKRPAA